MEKDVRRVDLSELVELNIAAVELEWSSFAKFLGNSIMLLQKLF
jgi:hypothetical protein